MYCTSYTFQNLSRKMCAGSVFSVIVKHVKGGHSVRSVNIQDQHTLKGSVHEAVWPVPLDLETTLLYETMNGRNGIILLNKTDWLYV